MADNTPKKVNKNVLGDSKQQTTKKGSHGGGHTYNQTAISKGFIVHDAKPGSAHNTDGNIKKQ